MIKLFDGKFRDHKVSFIMQAALAGVAVSAALILFDVVYQPVIIASFGASGFIAFTTPHRDISRPRCLIGGYIIGILVGCAMYYFTLLPVKTYLLQMAVHILAVGIAVALATFLMTITDTEHAPAASVAVGVVINDWAFYTLVTIMVGIIVISILKETLKRKMIDLL
ncbi:MAG: HPP family protein [Candidatus Omnitrophota bacterium]|nr:HPP family protein [Candidatus Omnitrophota bacterium]